MPTTSITNSNQVPWETAACIAKFTQGERGGRNCYHDDEHLAIRQEVAKLDDPQAGAVDWQLIIDQSQRLLTQHTKDLTLSCFATLALFEQYGLWGAVTGFQTVTGIVADHWEVAFPPTRRKRARMNAYEWLTKKLGQRLQDKIEQEFYAPSDDVHTKAALAQLDHEIDDFERKISENGEQFVPDFVGLRAALDQLTQSIRNRQQTPGTKPESQRKDPSEPSPPQPRSISPTPKGGAHSSPTLSGSSASTPEPNDPEQCLEICSRTLVRCAGVLRRANTQDPRAYTTLRQGIWMLTQRLPPTDAQGKTQIPVLDLDTRTRAEKMAEHACWPELLDHCESSLVRNRFAFDLLHTSDQALDGLGKSFHPARNAARASLAALLIRFPELTTFKFLDGTPLAQPSTLNWINKEILSASEHPSSMKVVPAPGVNDGEQSPLARFCTELAKKEVAGDPAKVADILAQATSSGLSCRHRAELTLYAASQLMQSNLTAPAQVLISGLIQRLEALGISSWEPKLYLDALELESEILAHLAMASTDDQRLVLERQRTDLRTRMAALDPSRALLAAN